MAFKTFNAGDVLTASDVNTYLMKQSVIVCTSGTRPSSPVEGMTIAETDSDRILTYDGSAWNVVAYYGDGESYTPSIQSTGTTPTMGNSTVLGRYWRMGSRRVEIMIWIKLGSSWAAGTGSYAVTLPVAVNATNNRWSLSLSYFDASITAYYDGFAFAGEDASGAANTTQARLLLDQGSTSGLTVAVTNAAPVIPAQNDIYIVSGSYYV